MKLKTILILAVLAALVGGGAWWSAQHQFPASPPAIGQRALPAFPLNEVNKISILAPGTNFSVVKTQEVWTVASRFSYPAKFAKVAECIQALDDLTIGQIITADKSQLGTFNLLTPAANAAPDSTGQAGTLLQLFNTNNQALAELVIGKHFQRRPPSGQAQSAIPGMGSYPDGQYIRVGEDQVLLVAKNLDRLIENTKYWLDDEFINIPAQDITEMTLAGPDRAPIVLRRARENEQLSLEGLGEGAGPADAGKISQLAGALNYLGFDDIAAPELTPKMTGLDQPIVVTARTRQNQLYTLKIGNTLTNDTFDRYAQVSVAYEGPPSAQPAEAPGAEAKPGAEAQKNQEAESPALAEQTKALNSKLSAWTYILKSYRVEPLLTKREDLIKKNETSEDAGKSGSLPGKSKAAANPPVEAVE